MNEVARISKEEDIPINGIHDLSRRVGAEGTDDALGVVFKGPGVCVSAPGVLSLFQDVNKETILSIHQTFGQNNLLIVQTDKRIATVSLAEVLGYTFNPSLTTQVTDSEEFMAKAIIVHQSSTDAGTVSGNGANLSGTTWETAPMTQILSQINPDGTPASFVTGLSGVGNIALVAGRYRLRGFTQSVASVGTDKWAVRMWNVTTGNPLFLGLSNASLIGLTAANSQNRLCHIFGDFTLAAPATISIQHWQLNLKNSDGFGRYDGFAQALIQTYRMLEIIKVDS